MKWTKTPAAQNQPDYGAGGGKEGSFVSSSASPRQPNPMAAQRPNLPTSGKSPEITVSKSLALSLAQRPPTNVEVFTLTMGKETIELLPFKNWNQLDHFKWTSRGKFPSEPAGLEITLDHVKIGCETVPVKDPAGSAKLQLLFNDWLLFERATLELARQKKVRSQPLTVAVEAAVQLGSRGLHFRVEVDKRSQVHIHCLQEREMLASIGLSVAGFNSLYQQGLIRRPRTLQTGALHDWVELDGELYSFEKGRNDATRLELVLNERYVPSASVGHAKQVVISLNAASSTGFDIQFPILLGGVPEVRRQHLNEESLNLLQDPEHCGLLHKEIIIKLTPPNLVFKQKTSDAGEQYLVWCPENTVNLTDEEGHQTMILLSQPLNLLRVSAAELTAVFNHPAIHRHARPAPPLSTADKPPSATARGVLFRGNPPPSPKQVTQENLPKIPSSGFEAVEAQSNTLAPEPADKPAPAETGLKPSKPVTSLPNLWLKQVLTRPALQHDWFAFLAYSRMAERFGNSSEGNFGTSACWFISLAEATDIEDPAFKGVFLTEKRSLGFLNQGQMARFYNGVAFLGPQKSALEGIDISLVAVALDANQRVVFTVSDNYRGQFGAPEAILTKVLSRLSECGVVVMSISEALKSQTPLEVVWTVPDEQLDPNDPQSVESTPEMP